MYGDAYETHFPYFGPQNTVSVVFSDVCWAQLRMMQLFWAGKTEFITIHLLWKSVFIWKTQTLDSKGALMLFGIALYCCLLFLWGRSRQRLIFILCYRGFLNLTKILEVWVRLDQICSPVMTLNFFLELYIFLVQNIFIMTSGIYSLFNMRMYLVSFIYLHHRKTVTLLWISFYLLE